MVNRRVVPNSDVIRAAVSSYNEPIAQAVEERLRKEWLANEQDRLVAEMKYMLDKHNATAKMFDVIIANGISSSAFQMMTGLGKKVYEQIMKRAYKVWDIRILISIIAGLRTKISVCEACQWLNDCGYHEVCPAYFLYYYLVRNYYDQPYQEWDDFCALNNLPTLGSKSFTE